MSFIIPYKKGVSGVHPDRLNYRDKLFGSVIGDEFDWDQGFEIKPKLKVENQYSSLSCVGQSFSKYAEVLHWYDVGENVDLSARDIYSQIYLPSGGAYLRDAAKVVCKYGVAEESVVPSYQNGNAPEEFMRWVERNNSISQNAYTYRGAEYFSCNANIDEVARAIKKGNGAVFACDGDNKGWSIKGGVVVPPKNAEWGHAIYAVGALIKDGKKTIKFINSWGEGWGEKGFGYVNEDYFSSGNVYGAWTIIDNPNKTMVIKKVKGQVDFYLIIGSKKILLTDYPTYQGLGSKEVEEVENLDAYDFGGSLLWVDRKIN